MKTRQIASILLGTLLVTFCFREAESSFHIIHGKLKLLKWLKAGIVAKAIISHSKKIPPIPIPIITKEIHSEHHYDHHEHYEGHHDYGHHHHPVIYHSTGWQLDKHGHGWH